jgi:hypothetical protein
MGDAGAGRFTLLMNRANIETLQGRAFEMSSFLIFQLCRLRWARVHAAEIRAWRFARG